MSRFRVGLAAVAMTMTALAVPGSFTAGGGVANAAPIPGGDIRTVCAGTDDPATNTFTLTADCGEVTSPLTVPDAYTVEGGGHIITATDPRPPGRHQSVQRWRGDECGSRRTLNM